MSESSILSLLLVASLVASACSAASTRGEEYLKRQLDERLRYEASDDSNDLSNELPRAESPIHQAIPASVLERQSSLSPSTVENKPLVPIEISIAKIADKARPVETDKAEVHKDLIKAIAFNSREIRIIGPDGREREMKDDVPTKMVIALENLQKEASDLWGTVNKSLDKGWSEFKTMIEDAVAPKNNKRESSAPLARQVRETSQSSLVELSDKAHGYVIADDSSTMGAKLESAGAKVRGFLTDTLGLNEDNQKRAGDALSKASASVGETVTKDIPDALMKAGTAVSDTVTKDIPDAFKNFFG